MSTGIAIAVFVVAYLLIATERIPKTAAALAGAGLILALGVVGSDDAFYSHDAGIDWDVIFLLLGMMIIVGILRRTGVLEYTAIRATKRAKGSPLRVMVLLVLITAMASAFLDDVTTVLLIAPVTLLVCDRFGINPGPFLIAEVLASNIGGAATLIGDPPNIIIGSRAGLDFNDFLVHMTPIIAIELVVFTLVLPWLFRGSFGVDPDRAADVMELNEREAIRDTGLGVIRNLAQAATDATGGDALLAVMLILVVSALLSGTIDNSHHHRAGGAPTCGCATSSSPDRPATRTLRLPYHSCRGSASGCEIG